MQQAPAAVPHSDSLTMTEAVSWALSLQRQVVAARLEVEASAVEATAAKLWPNPEFNYSVNNLVLGEGNDQERDLRPRFAEQTIQSFGIEQAFDVWRRRWARLRVAKAGMEVAQARVADVLREVVYKTRTAFLDAAKEERECALAQANAAHWHDSALFMARRQQAGDISPADLTKIELEALRADNAWLAAQNELRQARAVLVAQMGLTSADLLPAHLDLPARNSALGATVAAFDGPQLEANLMRSRPDVRAVQAQVQQAQAAVTQAKREALPDITVGLSYGRSQFMISGDNPHTLGLSIAVPLPIIDRNQVGRAQARIGHAQAVNELALLHIEVQRELAMAQSLYTRAVHGLQCFEGGGMLEKAEGARALAHRALKSGAFSVLDVLEAERTALEVHAEYLVIQHALFQAQAYLAYVTAEEPL